MNAEDQSLANIETCRRINRSAAAQYLTRGVAPDDVAVASIYSAHDLAMHAGRNSHDSIQWLRTALDIMERNLLDKARAG